MNICGTNGFMFTQKDVQEAFKLLPLWPDNRAPGQAAESGAAHHPSAPLPDALRGGLSVSEGARLWLRRVRAWVPPALASGARVSVLAQMEACHTGS